MRGKTGLLRIGAICAPILFAAVLGWSGPAVSTTQSVTSCAWVSVDTSSTYYAAGLRSGDLITQAGGKPIENDSDLYKVLAATTNTAQIVVEGTRKGVPFRVTVPAYLPPDVTLGSSGWDWVRYLKYYAPDPSKPDLQLRKAYTDFDTRRYAVAQSELTAAVAAGHKDPLTLTKLAWFMLRQRTGDVKANADAAIKLLEKAKEAYDPSTGDKETEAKIEGTWMLYNQILSNFQQAAIQGRRAMNLAPQLIGNRTNFYLALMEWRNYDDAATLANALADDYPRSIYFQRLKKNANESIGQMKGVIEACKALVDMLPDNIPTRLQLLPYLDRINDNYDLETHCNFLLRTKDKEMTDAQKAQAYFYMGRVEYRRRSYRKAEANAREAVRLRGHGEDHCLLADSLQARGKWSDSVVAYCNAQGKPWTTQSRDTWRQLRERMDASIDHMWKWQIKRLPANIRPTIEKRKQWLEERSVLKHSFIMRNRYGIRNVIIGIGLLLVLSGIIMKSATD
jgi:hypothetical protein